MTKFHLDRILPYGADQLWDLVGDVERYPEFIPGITSLRAYNHQAGDAGNSRFDADVSVGFKLLSERFTTRVVRNKPDTRVDMNFLKGPFKKLDGRWSFTPVDGGTRIDFDMDVEIRNPILDMIFKANFDRAVFRMMSVFETRAQELYGVPSA